MKKISYARRVAKMICNNGIFGKNREKVLTPLMENCYDLHFYDSELSLIDLCKKNIPTKLHNYGSSLLLDNPFDALFSKSSF